MVFSDKEGIRARWSRRSIFLYVVVSKIEVPWNAFMLKIALFTKTSSPEKILNSSSENEDMTCVWYRQSVADTSLAFRANVSGHWINGKAFTVLISRLFVKIVSDYGS